MITKCAVPARSIHLLAVLAAAAAALPPRPANAGHQTGSVQSYTGCLNPGGTIIKIAAGNAPARACVLPEREAHFSGGDITAISLGAGLTGGGDQGAVQIDLDPKYALPQGCDPDEVAKWDATDEAWVCAADEDTTYSEGTGLDLSAQNQFSIETNYRLPQTCEVGEAPEQGSGAWTCATYADANQTCASGQFARGVSSSGGLVCAAPPSVATAATVVSQPTPSGQGIPDDDDFHVYATFASGAGTHAVTVKGDIVSIGNVDQFKSVECALRVNGTTVDITRWHGVDELGLAAFPFTLIGVVSGSATVTLECRANEGADGVSLERARMLVVRVN